MRKEESLIRSYYASFFGDTPEFASNFVSDTVKIILNGESLALGRKEYSDFVRKKKNHYSESISELKISYCGSHEPWRADFLVHGKYILQYEDLPPASGQSYTISISAKILVTQDKIDSIDSSFDFLNWLSQINRRSR